MKNKLFSAVFIISSTISLILFLTLSFSFGHTYLCLKKENANLKTELETFDQFNFKEINGKKTIEVSQEDMQILQHILVQMELRKNDAKRTNYTGPKIHKRISQAPARNSKG